MFELDRLAQAEAIRKVLAEHGVLAALGVLNDRTPYRFTGIYKLHGDAMHAMQVFDRTAQQRSWVRAVPLGKSLCQYALQHGEFSVASASTDSRFRSHPYGGLVESYHGLLLRDRAGAPYGTLIHFDIAACAIGHDEAAFLREVAPMFSSHLD